MNKIMLQIDCQYLKMFKCGSVCCVYLVFYLILLPLTKDNAFAMELNNPADDFSRHRIVRPTIHHPRHKRDLLSSRDTSGAHHSELTVTVEVDGEEYVLDLRLNTELVPHNHIVRYQKDEGTVLHRPSREELDICQYTGTVRGRKGSWVAVSTCHGLRGMMYDGTRLKYIEPKHGATLQSDHYIYDHEDLVKHQSCGYAGGVTNNTKFDPHLHLQRQRESANSKVNRYKRSADETQVRGPYNSNRLSRYVELVLVVDNREYKLNGEDVGSVHHQMKDMANIINSVYAPLNIFIALVGVVVWTKHDEITLDENGDSTLTSFLQYRKKRLVPDIPNDNAQLLTRQTFANGVVGKALKGPICTYEFSGGVSTNHSRVLGLVAMTVAHEMGHNLGMEHDTAEDCTCPEDKCIMSPSSTATAPVHWSSCSLRSVALAFERGMDYCLRNKPTSLFSSPTCGNGFVEAGEQCDCGVHRSAATRSACEACCHPQRCMLRRNATCATGECCDLQTCRPMSAGAECRASQQECDLPEYCTGHSEYCPRDVHKMDAVPCDRGKAFCMRGSCRSHDDQCRLLWGTTGERSHDNCYTKLNINGSKVGNCGYDRMHQLFRPCAPQDALCGMLHCRHLNEQLEFGMETVATLTHTFINNNGVIIPCRTAIIDLGLNQVDPGLVPDGAKCGDGKMCLNQVCVHVEEILKNVSEKYSSVCPSDCSGRGVCNSEGHCHCDVGFAPPHCMLPGNGGSVDSGPASDPSVQRNFMVAMYVIFLGIIPSVLIVLLVFYYARHNVLFWWKRPRNKIQSPKKNSLQRRLSRGASKFAANFQNSHPPGSGSNGPAINVNTVTSPDDMSSSLLRDSERSPAGNLNPSVNFFGNFKGFSLTPVEKVQKPSEGNAIPNGDVKPNETMNRSAKITPVHRSGSNSQTVINQSILKPVLRSAPPLPVVPVAKPASPKSSPTVKRSNSSVQNRIRALMANEKDNAVNTAVVGQPPPRPVISSPILEASTCTAKELISPLQGFKTLGPARTAPSLPFPGPDLPKRPLSVHGNVLQKPLPEEPKKVKEGISLNRIASFLKQEKPKERQPVERSHSLPKNPNHQMRAPKAVDKVALRNLQISNPILQKEIELPVGTVPVVSDSEDGEDSKAFVTRAQSLRAPPASFRPQIQSFGSMRQPSGTARPTAPPPSIPDTRKDIESATFYQNPRPLDPKLITDYVDCIEEKQAPLAHIDEESGDNIYAIIEESPERPSKPFVSPPIKTIPQAPPEGYNTPKPMPSNSGSTESMGLLGEIVSEIQNRNFDSIYSATLSRKKKEKEKRDMDERNRDSTYANTDHYKTPESVYSNSGTKSSAASTTSSGYLHPSAVNVPTYLKDSVGDGSDAESKNVDNTPSSPTLKGANSKIPTFTRQITPPGLRNTTTFRSIPPSPKNTLKSTVTKALTANSPDLVSSCAVADINNIKPPDVINNNKGNGEVPKVAVKPNTLNKPAEARPPVDRKPTTLNSTVTSTKPVNLTSKTGDKNPLNRVNSKVDSNVKAIADNINKNKPKVVPKPSIHSVQRTDSGLSKPTAAKMAARPSNVANLQQKFENRKSFGRPTSVKK